ncbi:hypothetical protein [Methylobacterium sp. WSM2598]|uniref:hypothetical protein n=1 Tax=Methylobacterium sp. WSM2598 TaxID=398261 RepID=UPI000361BB15|nr:hypothetical protein [Methylobacterium sp. WSM2598]
MRTAVILAASAVALAACAPDLDPAQERVCRRVLPTLVAEGGRARVLGAAPGRAPRSIRIDFVEERPGRPPLTRWVVCRFSEMSRVDLGGVLSDRGQVGEAALYLLKHYYLDTPDAAAAEPAPG